MNLKTIQLEGAVYRGLIGAGVAYSMYRTQPIPLAIGAAGGYFAYDPIQQFALGLPLPQVVTLYAPEILAGGFIGYNLYDGSLMYAALGAAAGMAVKLGTAYLVAKEFGV